MRNPPRAPCCRFAAALRATAYRGVRSGSTGSCQRRRRRRRRRRGDQAPAFFGSAPVETEAGLGYPWPATADTRPATFVRRSSGLLGGAACFTRSEITLNEMVGSWRFGPPPTTITAPRAAHAPSLATLVALAGPGAQRGPTVVSSRKPVHDARAPDARGSRAGRRATRKLASTFPPLCGLRPASGSADGLLRLPLRRILRPGVCGSRRAAYA